MPEHACLNCNVALRPQDGDLCDECVDAMETTEPAAVAHLVDDPKELVKYAINAALNVKTLGGRMHNTLCTLYPHVGMESARNDAVRAIENKMTDLRDAIQVLEAMANTLKEVK